MKQEKSCFGRIFSINLLLVIPLLISSILGTILLRYDSFEVKQRNIEKLFHDSIATFSELIGDYQDKAAVICTKPQLSKTLFSETGPTQTEAFGVLNTMMVADDKITNMFIDFDMDHLCSMYGLVESPIFFGKTLGCNPESTARGIQITEEKRNGASFLHITDEKTVLFLGSNPSKVGSQSAYVGFILKFKELGGILRMIDNNQWYLLQGNDGSSCAIGFDSAGQAYIMPNKQAQQLSSSTDYYSLSEFLPEYGLTISLFSTKFLVGVGDDIWSIQIINIVLLLAAIVLSVILSWRSSEKRINDILKFREYIENGNAPGLAENHSLRLLNEPISKLREYEQLSITRQQELNQQLTYSLLCGMTEKSKIKSAFHKLEIQNIPAKFCMITISGITMGQKEFVSETLNSCLFIEIHEELINGVVCLFEMQTSDTDLLFRGKLATEIIEYGKEKDLKVKIGFSKVYSDLSYIEGAYKESLRSLRFLLVDSKEINSICAEEISVDGKYIFPDALFLTKISESLNKHNYSGAIIWCEKAINRSELSSATKENALFVRFSVLQKLVEFFTEECTNSDNDLLCICKEIDISNNSAFLNGVSELLSQATMEREQEDFAKVIQYIDANYQRYDLSHNEVAEIAQVNPGHLSKLFRNKLGITYINYLISVRMEKAAELLSDSSMLIEDVARVVGYENVASFRKIFKRKYGFSPAEYRLKNHDTTERNY